MIEKPKFELEQDDASYPEILLARECAPHTIYGVGCESALRPGIAVVGARNATSYGLRIARLIATWAVELGYTIYSGGARGCDQAAHKGAVEAGGKTVIVMGCGADLVYPSRAGKLFDAVCESGGAIISEYPWQMPPMKHRFIQRNRLIAALSDIVIVVEARLPSGTLSTVQHALDLGVPVAAVPGSILCLESAAPNRLIGEGAFPISCRDDLAHACSVSGSRPDVASLFADFNRSADDASIFEGTEQVESNAGKIYAACQSTPSLPDDLAQELNLSVVEVVEILTYFEVQGKVMRRADGRYVSEDVLC
ncbi:MAG: DNA-protecting protein DprA [Coriobacteriia bacterium]|nr:DNA-protecting protein DprA [Coriobacteriia bacterium]